MSAKADLWNLLGRQWVTPLIALEKASCLSLAQRVSQWLAAQARLTILEEIQAARAAA